MTPQAGALEFPATDRLRAKPVQILPVERNIHGLEPLYKWVVEERTEMGWQERLITYVLYKSEHKQTNWVIYRRTSEPLGTPVRRWFEFPDWADIRKAIITDIQEQELDEPENEDEDYWTLYFGPTPKLEPVCPVARPSEDR